MTIAPDALFDTKPSSVVDLTDQLRRAVARRKLREGDRLPTIRQIMDETGLAYNAVNRAIGALCAEGLLISRKRAGTFVNHARNEHAPTAKTKLNVFALVVPELHTGFYPALVNGFDAAAGNVGHQMIACATDNDTRKQGDIILQLVDKDVAGVALLPTSLGPPPKHQVMMLQRQGVPVVLLHRAVEGAAAPKILLPAEEIGATAGRAIVDHGHRRVAFIASHRSSIVDGYERGLRHAMAKGDAVLQWTDYGQMTAMTGAELAKYEAQLEPRLVAMLSQPDRPTVIFTSFDSVGEIVYLTALRMGMRIPQDLSILSVGGSQRDAAIMRRLAAVTVDEAHAGHTAVSLLTEMCAGTRPLDSDETFEMRIGLDLGSSLDRPTEHASN